MCLLRQVISRRSRRVGWSCFQMNANVTMGEATSHSSFRLVLASHTSPFGSPKVSAMPCNAMTTGVTVPPCTWNKDKTKSLQQVCYRSRREEVIHALLPQRNRFMQVSIFEFWVDLHFHCLILKSSTRWSRPRVVFPMTFHVVPSSSPYVHSEAPSCILNYIFWRCLIGHLAVF